MCRILGTDSAEWTTEPEVRSRTQRITDGTHRSRHASDRPKSGDHESIRDIDDLDDIRRPHPRADYPRTRLTRQFLLISAGFVAYGAVRALTSGAQTTAFDHANSLLTLEAHLGIDIEDDMQRFVLNHDHLRSLSNYAYVWMYWPALIGTLMLTWFRRPRLFYVFRDALLYSGAVGLTIFALYPVAPPRFLDGFVDTVDETQRAHFIAHPSFLINKFAALPSFHIGWVTLAAAILMLATPSRWLRALTTLPPAVMAFAVIVTANHYVADVIAGIAICLGALTISSRRHKGVLPPSTWLRSWTQIKSASRWEAWRRARHSSAAALADR